MTAWKIRSELLHKIGKGRYILAEYEKIKRITILFGNNYLLYVTTEAEPHHPNILDRIRKLEAGFTFCCCIKL